MRGEIYLCHVVAYHRTHPAKPKEYTLDEGKTVKLKVEGHDFRLLLGSPYQYCLRVQ